VNQRNRVSIDAGGDDLSDIAGARAGDEGAARALYERHVEGAYALARRLVGGRSDLAEEAVQDAFVRAFRALGEFRREASFGTWLTHIVATCVLDVQRREQRTARRFAPVDAAAQVSARTNRLDADLRDAVTTAVDALPDRQRVVLIMHDLEGYAHREIAELLRTPAGTVRRVLVEARSSVRAALSALGHDAL
jgi:RNA polymerase sigma-70 factor (ECF subfamily)